MKKPLIVFDHFSFQYRAQAQPTLHDICLTIYEGEKVLIVGPSGSGKSTLAHCLNGLVPFNYPGEMQGILTINGQEANNQSIFERSKTVGTVLQDPDGQFVGLTVGEDIAFSLENDCVPLAELKESTSKAAELVNVKKLLLYAPHELSGGQKQRVSLAGVIVNKVKILLFDEPLASLDPATGKKAIALIDEIRGQTNTTVVIIEHRLEDVLYRKVDRIILMEEGRITADLTPNMLLAGTQLRRAGIREPLYLTAMRYAGIEITPAHRPEEIATMEISPREQGMVQSWFLDTHPCPLPVADTPILQVENLTFGYNEERTVLRDVSFTIYAGEIVAIIGANGAGKSTLSKLVCGFELPDAGKILLAGQDLAGQSIAQRAHHIGYVMQNPNQMISKTMIFEEVALALTARGVQDPDELKERVERVLKICGLYSFRNWPVSALSYGQKKRVTIASVLLMEPEVIILDEPTAGQDFRHYTEIMEFLQNLNQQGVTVIMITHDMHLMLEYASRALVFSDAQLIANTTSADVLTNSALAEQASLKETSLFTLASRCGISAAQNFVQHFIDYDREAREGE